MTDDPFAESTEVGSLPTDTELAKRADFAAACTKEQASTMCNLLAWSRLMSTSLHPYSGVVIYEGQDNSLAQGFGHFKAWIEPGGDITLITDHIIT